MQKSVIIALFVFCWSALPLRAADNAERTVLKFFGGVDLLSSGNASRAILSSRTLTSISLRGGAGAGVQLLISLNENVRVGGEFGFIMTSFEQETSAIYDGRTTTAEHYIGFSPLIAYLDYHIGHFYLQGGIGLSIYRSYVSYKTAGPGLGSIAGTDTKTGGCTVLGAGFLIPLLGFTGLDFSVKYYSTFLSLNGTTTKDALLMPTLGIILRF